MTAKLQARLDDLRCEQAAGMEALAALQSREQELRTTLLRISGAIQVLEELLGEPSAEATQPASVP